MFDLNKSREALSVIEAELDILMYQLTPCEWANLSICVDKLNGYFDELDAEYSND